jgi:hypothetical protein
MRKFFEGHSFIGVAVIISVFLLAIFLRFYDLESQSPWTDELASWWYIRNLGEVWNRESHSPLYYALLRVFTGDSEIGAIRSFSATVSVIHLVECFFLGQLCFKKKHFLIFWILICLNPADIVYARMALHYAWLFEGVLVYYLLWRIRAPIWLQASISAFMGFIHVFALIPISFLALFRFWQEKDKKSLFTILLSANLVLVYYILRIILGPERVSINVSWNTQPLLNFWFSIISQFLGHAYPRFEFYPVNFWHAFLVVVPTSLWALYKRCESGVLYLFVGVSSLVVIEVLFFWLNLRACRYVIYIIGFWFVALVDSIEEVKNWQIFLVLGVVLLYLLFNSPINSHPWDREKVSEWQSVRANYPGIQKLICANDYQTDYFKLNISIPCHLAVSQVDVKSPLLFFDLSNTHQFLSGHLAALMDVIQFTDLKSGSIIYFEPKKNQDGKVKE